MERPKIKIELEPIDKLIELIGFLGLIALIVLPIYYFGKLPETIPSHFGANGAPDGYSGKNTIWILPIIGTLMYIGMFWLNKYPHKFNFPQKVTKENAKRLYTTGTKMIRILNVITTCFFAYITYATIQTSLESQSGLGNWFVPLVLILTLGFTGYFLFKSMSRK